MKELHPHVRRVRYCAWLRVLFDDIRDLGWTIDRQEYIDKVVMLIGNLDELQAN